MAIRGFGNIFGEQQTGDVGNVGVDLFFEMLFESLSRVLVRCSLQVALSVIHSCYSRLILCSVGRGYGLNFKIVL